MKFLVDAQLPERLARRLREKGHDVLHTKDLPAGNATTDEEINKLSLGEKRIVISKDVDFFNAFLVHGKPYKLLFVTTGNINNATLETLFLSHLDDLDMLFQQHQVIELSRTAIIVHI